jgi:hypothetical protein
MSDLTKKDAAASSKPQAPKKMLTDAEAMEHLMRSMMKWEQESQTVMREHNAYASRVMSGKEELKSDVEAKKK